MCALGAAAPGSLRAGPGPGGSELRGPAEEPELGGARAGPAGRGLSAAEPRFLPALAVARGGAAAGAGRAAPGQVAGRHTVLLGSTERQTLILKKKKNPPKKAPN